MTIRTFLGRLLPVLGLITVGTTGFCGESELESQGYMKESFDAEAVAPETWALVDELGRTWIPGKKNGQKDDKPRQVLMFYWLWHGDFAQKWPVRNTGDVISFYPEAIHDFQHPAWRDSEGSRTYFWGKPLFGYYSTMDRYILRKHCAMLAVAGVDGIVFDASNGTFTWKESYDILLEELDRAKRDGIATPKIAFLLNFAPNEESRIQLRALWHDIYSIGRGQEHWFFLDGKPLILAHRDCLKDDPTDRAINEFFTFRANHPSYFDAGSKIEEAKWGWCSNYPQPRYGIRADGSCEEVCVSIAQNSTDKELTAMNSPQKGVHGRSFSVGKDYVCHTNCYLTPIEVTSQNPDAMRYGINFQQQWDHALAIDPDIVFVTGWNEWVAGRHPEWQNVKNAFPDQFSPEYSRDIEPAAHAPGDNAYCQLFQNVRLFKNDSRVLEVANRKRTIDLNAIGDEWKDVKPVFRDYRGDTPRRDAPGWRNEYYRSDAQSNDIIAARVAYDDEFLYIMAELTTAPTPETSPAWMRLFLDVDWSGESPHWEGFEYVVNRNAPANGRGLLERSIGTWNFEPAGEVEYVIRGNRLEVKIPRNALQWPSGGDIPAFGFKWADGNAEFGNIYEFYQYGDAAPDGRFRFYYDPAARDGIPSILEKN